MKEIIFLILFLLIFTGLVYSADNTNDISNTKVFEFGIGGTFVFFGFAEYLYAKKVSVSVHGNDKKNIWTELKKFCINR